MQVFGKSTGDLTAQRIVKFSNETTKRDPNRLAERTHLDEVQSPFAAFTLADERLRVSEAFGKFDLSYPGLLSRLPQMLKED